MNMVKKKSTSFAEQLAELSNPAPSLDLEGVDSDTEAKLVDFDEDSSEETGGQQQSHLRKLTSLPLSEGDQRYAGQTTSRDNWLGDPDSDGAGDGTSSDVGGSDDDDDEDNSVDEEEKEDYRIDVKKQTDNLMDHFKKISAELEESESDRESSVDDDEGDDDYDDDDDDRADAEQKGRSEKMKTSKFIAVEDEADDEEEDEEESEEDDDEKGVESEDEDEELEDEDPDTGFSEEDGVKPFSQGSPQEELQRGQATKSQLGLWDSILEARIKLQKALSLTNQMPQHNTLEDFIEYGGSELEEALSKGKEDLQKLVSSMIELQETLLLQNPETCHVVDGSKPVASKPSGDGDDEEIPSNDEEIPSNDEEIPSDDEEIPSDDEEIPSEDEVILNKTKMRKQGKHSPKTNQSLGTKRKVEESEYGGHLAKRHKDFEEFRNTAIQKWHDRTKLSTGKISSKSFSSFDKSPLAQIQQVLQDRDRLIKRTQLKRTAYKVMGKPESEDKTEDAEKDEDAISSPNAHLKDYDSEIFDDDDFYHQLLRELIEKKSSDTSDPVQLTRQWLEVQKLRSKVKKRVDTKASKGRKLRYDVHQKLVSYMAPFDTCDITGDARDELYGSLFGQRKFNHTGASER